MFIDDYPLTLVSFIDWLGSYWGCFSPVCLVVFLSSFDRFGSGRIGIVYLESLFWHPFFNRYFTLPTKEKNECSFVTFWNFIYYMEICRCNCMVLSPKILTFPAYSLLSLLKKPQYTHFSYNCCRSFLELANSGLYICGIFVEEEHLLLFKAIKRSSNWLLIYTFHIIILPPFLSIWK